MQPLPPHALQNAFDHGVTLCQTNRFLEAEVLYQNILEQYPGHPEALHMLGVLAYSTGEFARACQLMGEAHQRHPDSPLHHLQNYAISLSAADRDDEAIPLLEKVIVADPEQPRALGRLGYALQKLGRPAEALDRIKKALQADPTYAEGYYFLGITLQGLGLREEAIVAFRKAWQAQPPSNVITNLLGNAFNREGLEQEALACYRAGLAFAPRKTPADPNRIQSNALLRKLCADIKGHVLSVGSGNDSDKEGSLYREYFPASASYFRLDLDNNLQPDFTGDIQNIQGVIADQAYDVIFSVWALEHVPDVHAAIAEIHRILRPGGIFVFGLPLNCEFHAYPHDYHRFTMDGINDLLQNKFRLEEIHPVGEALPFSLDHRLTLIGKRQERAVASYVGRCQAI